MIENDLSKKTNVMVYFLMRSDEFIQWEEINDMLQIQPRLTWKKGELNPDVKGQNYKYSRWEIGSNYCESFDINEQLTPLLDLLVPKKDILKRMKEKYPLDYKIIILINMRNGRTPGIVIDRRCNAFVHFIEADIDIDTYVYPYTDDM